MRQVEAAVDNLTVELDAGFDVDVGRPEIDRPRRQRKAPRCLDVYQLYWAIRADRAQAAVPVSRCRGSSNSLFHLSCIAAEKWRWTGYPLHRMPLPDESMSPDMDFCKNPRVKFCLSS